MREGRDDCGLNAALIAIPPPLHYRIDGWMEWMEDAVLAKLLPTANPTSNPRSPPRRRSCRASEALQKARHQK